MAYTRWQNLLVWCRGLWHVLRHMRALVSSVDRERMNQAHRLYAASAPGVANKNELWWSKELAGRIGGAAEFRTADGSRVDILTDRCAIEVEWAKKWKESIGQALFYAAQTNLEPAVVLLMEGDHDEANYLRCLAVCGLAGIELVVCDVRSGQADGLSILCTGVQETND